MANEIILATAHNCDDVQLTWRTIVDGAIDEPIEDCLGFMIERQRWSDDANDWGQTEILRNRVGFTSHVPAGESGAETTRKSSVWPFQRYDWTEHGANNGDKVRYRIAAMRAADGDVIGTSELASIVRSPWSSPLQVSGDAGGGVSAYFNRGAVISQFVARIARENQWTPRQLRDHAKDLEEPLRRFLSGDLRVALLELLDQVIEDPRLELHAALYELS